MRCTLSRKTPKPLDNGKNKLIIKVKINFEETFVLFALLLKNCLIKRDIFEKIYFSIDINIDSLSLFHLNIDQNTYLLLHVYKVVFDKTTYAYLFHYEKQFNTDYLLILSLNFILIINNYGLKSIHFNRH